MSRDGEPHEVKCATMKRMACAIGQALVLVLVAAGLGLGTNAVRGKDRIHLTRDYFRRPTASTGTATAPAATQPNDDQATPSADPNAALPFQVIGLEEVKRLFDDPKSGLRAYVFVDARADEPFQRGHIPGAVQCDYYRIDFYIENVLNRVLGAEKVVVYCNGGDCEDSLHVCGELVNSQVPWGNIYLFKGGWQEWAAAGYPVETGPARE